jgi:hypothetical protein
VGSPLPLCGTSCVIDTTALPVAGTYTITVDPTAEYTGALTARVYAVPADPVSALTVGGPATTLTLSAAGQKGTWTFTGAAGQRVTLSFTGGTFGAVSRALVTLRRPDGTALAGPFLCGTTCTIPATTLPVAGTYSVLLDPSDLWTGALTGRVTAA